MPASDAQAYQSPGVLIADEVGDFALRQPESRLLFQFLSVPHKPEGITINRVFTEWNQIFAEDAVARGILHLLADKIGSRVGSSSDTQLNFAGCASPRTTNT